MAKKEKEGTKVEVLTEKEARAVEVRGRVVEIKSSIEENYAELARLLHEVNGNGYWSSWGFVSFQEYCESELELQYRKARYLVSIAEAVARARVSWDRIVHIGWTKMRTIAPLLTNDNSDLWLDRAETCTQDQLVQMTKDVSSGTSEVSVSPQRIVNVQLRMNEDQSSIILDAVDHAKRLVGADSIVPALEHICYDWMQSSQAGPTRTDLRRVLDWVQRTYSVELVPSGGQDLDALLNSVDNAPSTPPTNGGTQPTA